MSGIRRASTAVLQSTAYRLSSRSLIPLRLQRSRQPFRQRNEEGQSKLKGNGKSVPALSAIKSPLRDGDLERPDDEAYKNSYFINANSATAPGIVDADRQPILERSEVYSGVYGRASINLYAFNSNGNKGIACGAE